MKKTVASIFCVLLVAMILCGCTVAQIPTASPTMQDPSDTLPPQTEAPTSNTATADPEVPTQSATAELETETPTVNVPTVTPSVTAPEVTATPKPAVHIIEDFDSGTVGQLISTVDWSQIPQFGVTNAAYSITDNNTESKSGLLVTISDAGAVAQNITLSSSKVTSAYTSDQLKYVRFYINNNTSVQLGLSIVIHNASKYANYGVSKSKVTDANGTDVSFAAGDPSDSSEGSGINTGLYVPAGFKGWVAFEATELVAYFPSQYALLTNTKSVTDMILDVRAHGAKAGESYVIDQVCFASTASPITETATPTAPAVTPSTNPASSWEGKYLSFNNSKTEITVSANSKNNQAEFPTFTFSGEATLNFNSPVNKTFNYYSLRYKSTEPLWMYIKYTRNGAAYEELCFLDASSKFINFNSFIDGVMDNTNIKGSSITGFRFVNRGNKSATVVVSAVTDTNNTNLSKMIYLQNSYVKIGADLVYGGALALLEYLKEPVALGTQNGRAEIVRNYSGKAGFSARNTSVNLLNNYDTGRLVQQSYYGTFGGNNDGYTPGQFSGMTWCYNPVMGGDKGNNHSKIIDFKATGTSIYVKCRPMDWGKTNSPTYSYMESTYTLEDRKVIVDNRFVDYSLYQHIVANQELPALYVAEPFYNLIHYDGSKPWTYGNWKMHTGLPDWNGVWPIFKSTENWWAWVNNDSSDLFGIGLYVPDVTEVTGGIYGHGGSINYSNPSKSTPTSYIAPLRKMKIVNYKPIEYSYALICGGLSEIIQSVYTMNSQDRINNQSLVNYK